jgi:hypothetical protein
MLPAFVGLYYIIQLLFLSKARYDQLECEGLFKVNDITYTAPAKHMMQPVHACACTLLAVQSCATSWWVWHAVLVSTLGGYLVVAGRVMHRDKQQREAMAAVAGGAKATDGMKEADGLAV